MSDNIVLCLIDKFGTAAALADRLGVSRQLVSHWKKTGRIPVERLKAVEAASGISRRKLRPDIFA